MGIFGRWKKKPWEGKKPAQPPKPGRKQPSKPLPKPGEKKPEKARPAARDYSGRKAKLARAMAAELSKFPRFLETCKRFGLSEPEQAFVDFYLDVNDNQAVWKAEAKEEERAEDAGKKFSRTSFYGKLFLKCRGNPKNVSSALFEWQ